jgi:hypothetical protein
MPEYLGHHQCFKKWMFVIENVSPPERRSLDCKAVSLSSKMAMDE